MINLTPGRPGPPLQPGPPPVPHDDDTYMAVPVYSRARLKKVLRTVLPKRSKMKKIPPEKCSILSKNGRNTKRLFEQLSLRVLCAVCTWLSLLPSPLDGSPLGYLDKQEQCIGVYERKVLSHLDGTPLPWTQLPCWCTA